MAAPDTVPNVEVVEGADGGWRFRVTTASGEVIATSEPYATKYQAKRGIGIARRLLAEPVPAPPQSREPAHIGMVLADGLEELAATWEHNGERVVFQQSAAERLRGLLQHYGYADTAATVAPTP